MNKKIFSLFLIFSLSICFLTGCDDANESVTRAEISLENKVDQKTEIYEATETKNEFENEQENLAQEHESNTYVAPKLATKPFDLSMVEEYSGVPYFEINNNIPYFTQDEITDESFEQYDELDNLGRCTHTIASVGQDLMPTEKRGSIGMIKPSGWQTIRYDDLIADKYLYNRCHLIGYQLTGENVNLNNLITGTRYMNVEGMLPFEDKVANYVSTTGNHVMYRSTPIFEGDNLVANGVLMEGWSVEDNGEGICFCVFVYNVQPGININYANGESSRVEEKAEEIEEETPTQESSEVVVEETQADEPVIADNKAPAQDYIINTNTGKFHYPWCSSVNKMKEKNKWYYTGSRDDIIDMGYQPCKRCNP